ncbi:hypothetical protein CONPUDRAFT_159880 [Coniophora puteana RWD-64-598 SS2]|uniref:Uncharacterized protein n=1 Tax=Coniophora puteana (strain RWD-64-598) TaxID=741705 RepID=R7SFE4_CONPW|nr:uncharacterized protein CONPUDRAFT_159880 [Coniophora puteana RWD-64-598 SS2]EIW74595.1 hypothetical protein CONPUDRAFT_159880 [Coniophora puteana RWD-64-598 SS2]
MINLEDFIHAQSIPCFCGKDPADDSIYCSDKCALKDSDNTLSGKRSHYNACVGRAAVTNLESLIHDLGEPCFCGRVPAQDSIYCSEECAIQDSYSSLSGVFSHYHACIKLVRKRGKVAVGRRYDGAAADSASATYQDYKSKGPRFQIPRCTTSLSPKQLLTHAIVRKRVVPTAS